MSEQEAEQMEKPPMSNPEADSPGLPPAEKPHGPPSFPEGGARAWSVATGCAGVLFCTFGWGNAFGNFQAYYETHQLANETSSAISWIGSLQIFFLLGSGLVGGPLFDRYGAKVIYPSAITYVFAVMMTSLCKEYYQVILAQGILGGISQGMTMAPCLAAVSQYFHAKRGAAMGIVVGGSSLGGVIFPIALDRMFNSSLGFGWTVRICGFIMLAILIPSTLVIRARLPPRKDQLFLPRALAEPKFYTLIFSVFLMIVGVFGPFFYLPTYAIEHGMSNRLAFYLPSILNAASFFGRVIPGITADKIGRYNMLFAAGLSTGIIGLCWQRVYSNAAIIVFTVFYGFTSGAIISLMTACFAMAAANPRDIGTYMGMGMFMVSFAALIGAPICGALVSRYHGFTQVSIFTGITVLAGSCMLIIAKWTNGKGLLAKI